MLPREADQDECLVSCELLHVGGEAAPLGINVFTREADQEECLFPRELLMAAVLEMVNMAVP